MNNLIYKKIYDKKLFENASTSSNDMILNF